jgi:hypothetical protein
MVSLRKAVGTEAKPLIGLYAESGRGKTYGALLIAKGFVDDMSQVVMIETEAAAARCTRTIRCSAATT